MKVIESSAAGSPFSLAPLVSQDEILDNRSIDDTGSDLSIMSSGSDEEEKQRYWEWCMRNEFLVWYHEKKGMVHPKGMVKPHVLKARYLKHHAALDESLLEASWAYACLQNDVSLLQWLHGDLSVKKYPPPLVTWWASLANSLEVLQFLRTHNLIKPTFTTPLGSTPLLVAAARNHFKAIELLLECANVEESHVEEALQVAAAVDAIDAIQSLSSHTNTHVGINSTKGVESAMLVACRAGHITTLQTLRANHPDLNWGVVTHDGLNCVGLAAFYNHGRVIEYLCRFHDAENKKAPNVNYQFEPPCHNNIEEDDTELCKDGVRRGDSPVHLAVRRNHISALTALCRRGTDLVKMSLCNECGQTALHVAISHDTIESVQKMVQQLPEGPDRDELLSNHLDQRTGMSPLYLACYLGRVEIVRLLAPAISNPNQLCHISNTVHLSDADPLTSATTDTTGSPIGMRSRIGSADTLAHSTSSSMDRPPLMGAVLNNHVETVTALLACPAVNVNQMDGAGHTAISLAAKMGFFRICQILVLHNANLELQSHRGGGTPVAKARKYRHHTIVQLLEKYGGR
uniref:Uncharacterized protein n=1 Tax=Attheya septentrionalis TaxID=420275 RepID=A0A7S2XMW0_9STRA|mmetsp:Transcript_2194/g.3988  ORF Transcript_2194/g.3988 Transcript_2194/m.3988 type:complete len:572 (+) Transcript_2194:250-1965(+)